MRGSSLLDILSLFSYAHDRRTIGQLSFPFSQTSQSGIQSLDDCLQSPTSTKQIYLAQISLVVREDSLVESEPSISRAIRDASASTLQPHRFVLVRSSSCLPFSRSAQTTTILGVDGGSTDATSMSAREECTSMQGQAQTSTKIFSSKLSQLTLDDRFEDMINLLV